MKSHVTRNGRLLGGYVPIPIVTAIHSWISEDPERDISTFIRQAAREKLVRDGITLVQHEIQAGRVKARSVAA